MKRLLLPNDKESVQCNVCSASFVKKFQLMKHSEANHKRIICENCDFISYGKRNFDNHQKVEHGMDE